MQPSKSQESSSIFNLSPEGYNELLILGVTLDQLFILENYQNELDLSKILESSRFQANRQSLIRKGYLNIDNTITTTGAALLNGTKKSVPLEATIEKSIKDASSAFDDWWTAFPSSDIFQYKGKKFNGTRNMKVKKEDCRKKFGAIMAEGNFTLEEMIRALRYEVYLKKEDSIKSNYNQLRFMHNSYTYLNQRDFEAFIEPSKGSEIDDRPDAPVDNSDI